jgi:hypothetical protein
VQTAESETEIPEEISRLTECFQFIAANLYKDLGQPLVLKELQKLTFDLMKTLPLDFNTEFAFSIVLLYLLSTYQDLVVY